MASSDSNAVSLWVDLLADMKLSVTSFEGLKTGPLLLVLSFTTDTEEIHIGSGLKNAYIYAEGSEQENYSFHIDNYDELKDRLSAAEKAVRNTASN